MFIIKNVLFYLIVYKGTRQSIILLKHQVTLENSMTICYSEKIYVIINRCKCVK